MATTFFEQQSLARRRTSQLVFLYCCAIVLIIFAVYMIVYAAWQASATSHSITTSLQHFNDLEPDKIFYLPSFFEPWLFFRVALITAGIIILGTLYKVSALSSGGSSVAKALGGQLIDPSTQDANERKALNVVEEMAIASGLPVPSVYSLDKEEGINAFASGFGPSDAVIGITKGCLTKLKREELQGVIGHEFSHILNGDMRLNIRLIGILHGILLIGLIGETLMRIAQRSRSSNDKGFPVVIVLTGLGLFIVGYIGVFFGRLIKSAVSRQREFLADASSVQFTRNPAGLSGALKKILAYTKGSELQNDKAEQASHMFFSNALGQSLMKIFETHPPLVERIKRIDPSFKVDLIHLRAELDKESLEQNEINESEESSISAFSAASSPNEVISSIGQLRIKNINAASAIVSGFDPIILSAARNELGARALLCGIIISIDTSTSTLRREILHEKLGNDLAFAVEKLLPNINKLRRETFLPLIDMCIPSLRKMRQSDYLAFKKQIDWLIHSDNVISFLEYALSKLVFRNLDTLFFGKIKKAIKFQSVKDIAGNCADLLSHIAVVGDGDLQQKTQSFREAMKQIGLPDTYELLEPKSLSLAKVDAALEKLEHASFEVKEKIMRAAATCMAFDGVINTNEMCLIRALGSHLDCPVPLQ